VSINIYEQMFINNQVGVAAAIAVVYLVFVIAIANIVIAKVGFEGVGLMATTDGDSATASQRLDKDTRETLVTVLRHTVLLTWSFIVLFPLYWLASMSLKPLAQRTRCRRTGFSCRRCTTTSS